MLAVLHFVSQAKQEGQPVFVTSYVELLCIATLGTVVGGVTMLYRKHNCHVQGCWRLQWKTVPGTDHVVCRRHHPADAPTHAQVLADAATGTSS
jgi:hypothetical protein